jgi:hypothetical protein
MICGRQKNPSWPQGVNDAKMVIHSARSIVDTKWIDGLNGKLRTHDGLSEVEVRADI